jgi:hypothetical protein
MKSHCKVLGFFSFLVFAVLAIFPFNRVSAVTMNPSSGNYYPGTQLTINVTAAPTGANSNAVAIRLAVTGATVISFVPVSGGAWVGATADCAGSSHYTSTTVCSSLAKVSTIVAGETLGTLVIQLPATPGTVTIERTAGNEYSNGLTSFPSTGTAASFTVSTSGVLPNTAITDTHGLIIVMVSILLVATGFVLIKLKPLNQN